MPYWLLLLGAPVHQRPEIATLTLDDRTVPSWHVCVCVQVCAGVCVLVRVCDV